MREKASSKKSALLAEIWNDFERIPLSCLTVGDLKTVLKLLDKSDFNAGREVELEELKKLAESLRAERERLNRIENLARKLEPIG